MKKFLLLFLLPYMIPEVMAGCLYNGTKDCKVENPCGPNELMTIKWLYEDGQVKYVFDGCFPCDTEQAIEVSCIGAEEAQRICPNRYIFWDCTPYSVLNCKNKKYLPITSMDNISVNKKDKTCWDNSVIR